MNAPNEFQCVDCQDYFLEYDLTRHYTKEHDYTIEAAEEMLDSEYIKLHEYVESAIADQEYDAWKEREMA